MQFAPPKPRREEEHILPLVNIVFLLLIFFILAGSLTSLDPIAVEPPRARVESAPAPRDLVLSLGADGAVALDGALIERDALGPALAARLGDGEAGPEESKSTVTVWLRADGAADALDVMAVMEALREAGLSRFQLLTLPANGEGE